MSNGEVGAMGGGVVAAAVNETSVAAVAARAKAVVEARYIVAQGRPRNMDTVRVRILDECKRPGFAEVARYSKPIGGKKIEGLSIRFVEVALRHMGNVDVSTLALYEDDEKRIVEVAVTDLQTNATFADTITVTKRVERRSPREGQTVLGQRQNSRGDTVYIVEAGDEELATKQGAMISKMIRTLGLRLVPGDIQDEAEATVLATQRAKDAEDPAAARKRIIDAFHSLGVDPGALGEYLGHTIEASSPAELADLRAVYAAIRSGDTTWPEVMRTQAEEGREPASRAASTLDAKDVAQVEKALTERVKAWPGVSPSDIQTVLLADQPLVAVAKSDLPRLLKAIHGWEPPRP